MSPTGSFLWHCNNCGRVNDGGQLTCTLCGGLYKSGDPPWQPPALAHRPDKGSILRRFFVICLIVGIALFDHPNSKNEEYTDTDNAITGLAWSPNGKYLLSGNNADQVILQVVL
jgi:WD40 repeat protein